MAKALEETSSATQSTSQSDEITPITQAVRKHAVSRTKDTDQEKGVTESIVAHPHDADEAMKAFADTQGEAPILTEADNKRLLRIIDWHLMPLMCAVYGLNFLDRYIVWEYPSVRLLQRLPLAKYSAFCIIGWGMIVTFFAVASNFSGALALRFFLGMFESAVTPGFTLVTSQWYTKHEQGTRIGIWFSWIGWGSLIGSFITYGIGAGARQHGSLIPPWKSLFIITGLITISFGVWFWWLIPDNQLNARWLTKEDRVLAVARVRVNQQGIGNRTFKMYQFKEALLDPMSWAFAVFAIMVTIALGGISAFFNELIVGFGYTPEQSLLYGAASGAGMGIYLPISGYLGDRLNQRLVFSMVALMLSIVGVIMMTTLQESNRAGCLAGFYLLSGAGAPTATILGMISANIAGYTKKTTVAGMFLVGYCVGNVIGLINPI
ncbi:hypothetical protein FQN57_005017 [Myotisia sp. PD_48]|nr:hypothetical protein FQN57_005017 [Myotisia sp. PD_48]